MRCRRRCGRRSSEAVDIALRGLDLSQHTTETRYQERFAMLPKDSSGGNARAGVSRMRLLGRSALGVGTN